MAFKLDFTKLNRVRSAEEIEAEFQKERAAARAADAAKRAAFAGKSLTLTVSETYSRFTLTSDRDIQMWGTDDKGRQTRARMFIPECYDRDAADSVVSKLVDGGTFTMHGYWKPTTDKDGHKSFGFRVQRIDGVDLTNNIAIGA